ncbi:GNAT family N-acetyltransferase [Defluviimonas sp. SAOS-178_SWC]|uniref:GNAT family N-acetyltransferase n=1 Tax=Defluviimonas sp. SAOS-178_SWC TaxID=3121287 RepID=UPI003221553F
MIVRAARAVELAELSLLCLRSKAVWGYDPEFIAACRAELTVAPDDLPTTLVAERRGHPVGVVQVTTEGTTATLKKLFVEPHEVGTGIGAMLFAKALKMACAAGAVELIIAADPAAAGFFSRMGARSAGEAPSGCIPGLNLPRFVLNL